MSSEFSFPLTESFNKKMVQIGKEVSEKIQFEFLYVHDLGQRRRRLKMVDNVDDDDNGRRSMGIL